MGMFTESQLALIRGIAEECTSHDAHGAALKQKGDAIAVWKTLDTTSVGGWEHEALAVIKFASEECERQDDSAMSVYDYCLAFDLAVAHQRSGRKLDLELLGELCALVVPGSRFRRPGDAVVAGDVVVTASPAHQVEDDLAEFEGLLLAHQNAGDFEHDGKPVTAQSIYELFERIHPRTDGNGRVGQLIYNWLADTLEQPSRASEPEDFLHR